MMLDQGQAYSHSITAETFSGMNSSTTSSSSSSIRKKKNKNKRRFSDEQIRSLESIFQSESRLEPRKKLQLATELGLQPRQVAIWFQNKRARWKSKQLEREYCMLRANYNTLASKFEALKKEKQALIKQLQKMNELIESPIEEIHCYKQAVSRNSIDRESDSEQQQTHKLESDSEQQTHKLESDSEQQTHKLESEVKPSWSLGKKEHGLGILSDDDDDSTKKAEYFGLEDEPNLINMVEPGDGSMTSPEDWGSLNSDGLFDESSSSYQWWDFWS